MTARGGALRWKGLSEAVHTVTRVLRYQMFRRSPDSALPPDQWVDALLAHGWETWGAGRAPGA